MNFEYFVFEEEKINNPLGYFYTVLCYGILTLMSLKPSLDHPKAEANPEPASSIACTSTNKKSPKGVVKDCLRIFEFSQ